MDARAQLWIAQTERDRQRRAAGLFVGHRHLTQDPHQQLLTTVAKTAMTGVAAVSLGPVAATLLLLPS